MCTSYYLPFFLPYSHRVSFLSFYLKILMKPIYRNLLLKTFHVMFYLFYIILKIVKVLTLQTQVKRDIVSVLSRIALILCTRESVNTYSIFY